LIAVSKALRGGGVLPAARGPVQDIALTTNGALHGRSGPALKAAGLDRDHHQAFDWHDGEERGADGGSAAGPSAGEALLAKGAWGCEHARAAGFGPPRPAQVNAVIGPRPKTTISCWPLAALARRLGWEVCA